MLEQKMTDHPLLATLITKQLPTCDQKQSPTLVPSSRVANSVSLFQYLKDLAFLTIHYFQPGVASSLIVGSVPGPCSRHLKNFVKLIEKIKAGHDTTGKKVLTHPIRGALGLKFISEFLMTKDVNEEFAVGCQPTCDAA